MLPVKDGVGLYYPVCTFQCHPGVVREKEYRSCETKHCTHYLKAYIRKFPAKAPIDYGNLSYEEIAEFLKPITEGLVFTIQDGERKVS